MLTHIDLRTIFFLSGVLNLVVTVLFIFTWYIHRKKFPETGLWTSGLLCITLGNLLLFLRDTIPIFFSIPVGNTLLVLGMALLVHGVLNFLKLRSKNLFILIYLFPIITFLSFVYYAYIDFNLVARIVIVSSQMIIYMLILIYTLLRFGKSNLPRNILLLSASLLLIDFLVRIPFTILLIRGNNFMNSGFFQSVTMVGWMVSIVGISIGLIFMISYRLQNEYRLLAVKNSLLVKEMHHRVKNNLSIIQTLLNLQSDSSGSKEVKDILTESTNRVTSIKIIHQMLYTSEELTKLNMKEYLIKLSESVFRSYNPKHVKLEVSIAPFIGDIQILIQCGLMLTEILSNSCKYAFKRHDSGVIKIIFEVKGEHLSRRAILLVSDNGIGMDKERDFHKKNHLGHQIIESSCSQLNGKMTINTKKGTAFRIEFPVQVDLHS